ncbi:hypothetical protein BOTBODRAFT_36731 [Botryobasidium botryosum FD-172 SS1]|uniref:HNH domain-containing protein n=1 Tax=Botryobasidium botryosum (strain FD-172 SS1) TaxID=930990 RepID=A0A067MEB8_BOTB1|nr:hypothetical protein BOTBODRAFT_36731 [Botryobasidium botryosum FD-172 SS1]
MSSTEDTTAQSSIFKDCLARRVIAQPALSDTPDASSSSSSGSDLDEFISYLASEVWETLPSQLRALTHEHPVIDVDADALSLATIPGSFTDTLVSYGIAADPDSACDFLRSVLRDYVDEARAPPPAWSSTRTSECEICERDVPLTYHHLIPRSTHTKVLKRKWHPESLLNSVAWLCRPCHSAVHGIATNEELAREYYTIELLLTREDIQKWKKYASKQRWGVRRG